MMDEIEGGLSPAERRVEDLLRAAAPSLRGESDGDRVRRVLAPVRRRRRAVLLRLGGWTAAAAALVLLVLRFPSPSVSERGRGGQPAPRAAEVALPPAEPEAVREELEGLRQDARAALAFVGRRLPLASRLMEPR